MDSLKPTFPPKVYWPQLKGKSVSLAKETIEGDDSHDITFRVQIFFPGCGLRNVQNYAYKRVNIFADREDGVVIKTPENG